jgi:hypothetical protein
MERRAYEPAFGPDPGHVEVERNRRFHHERLMSDPEFLARVKRLQTLIESGERSPTAIHASELRDRFRAGKL